MFSKTTEYALRAAIYIAQKGSENNKLGIPEISKAIHSPASFTAKILQKLSKNNSLLSAVRGPNGGYYFTQKAIDLPVIKIIEAMGEDEVLKKCVLGLKACSNKKPCPLHHEYKGIKAKTLDLFNTHTIGWLALEMKKGESFL